MLIHALIVEAAETLFVPAAVYNNTDGDADAAVLESFDEAAWNNPVVRVIDARRRDLGPRFATGWQVSGMAHTLRAGLSATPAGAPNWFSAFDSELDAHRRGVATAVFGMT